MGRRLASEAPRELETLLEGHSEIEDGRLQLVRLRGAADHRGCPGRRSEGRVGVAQQRPAQPSDECGGSINYSGG
jgi:hypothetical protein